MSPTLWLALFGAGVASFASPCVLPLVPVWIGIAAGEAGEAPGTAVRATAWFVGGFAAVFVLLGAIAGRVGGALADADAWLPRAGGVLVIVFGLAMVGLPLGRLDRESRLLRVVPSWARSHRSTAVRAGVAGVAFGAAWTPCVGPLLGSALVAAGGAGSVGGGSALLLAYALGIGLPFLLAALALASWPDANRRLARHAPALRVAGGVVLVIVGGALAAGLTDELLSPVARLAAPT